MICTANSLISLRESSFRDLCSSYNGRKIKIGYKTFIYLKVYFLLRCRTSIIGEDDDILDVYELKNRTLSSWDCARFKAEVPEVLYEEVCRVNYLRNKKVKVFLDSSSFRDAFGPNNDYLLQVIVDVLSSNFRVKVY